MTNGRCCLPRATAFGLVAFAAALSTAACAEPLEFADWTIDVPEGTPVVEYADVPMEEREGQRIGAVEELTITPREGDDNYTFYRPTEVRVDSGGQMYVFDSGNSRVQVFEPSGEYLRTLGQQGGGPGEFQSRGGFTSVMTMVADDRFFAFDLSQSRISEWAGDGAHQGDRAIPGLRLSAFLAGQDDGTLISRISERREGGGTNYLITGISPTGETGREYVTVPSPGSFQVGRIGLAHPAGMPKFAAAADGTVYASPGDEYQVLAIAPDGRTRWALRVARSRPAFGDEHRDRILNLVTSNFPDADTSGTDWPAELAAISMLAVDGHGHLYVTGPTEPLSPDPDEIDVDIYDAAGERLFSGTMPFIRWSAALDDFVYAFRPTDEGEPMPVRYRLEEPFKP